MTGDVHIETTQNVSPILDGNKALANDPDYWKQGVKNDMAHYARVPDWVQVKWLNEYGYENWPMHPQNGKLLFRLLNSPEWKWLKTTEKTHAARS